MGYMWVDAEELLRKATKKGLEQDDVDDEIYLLLQKVKEND